MLPYLKGKLDTYYERVAHRRNDDPVLPILKTWILFPLFLFGDFLAFQNSVSSTEATFKAVYPIATTCYEGLHFVYQLLYM